MDKQKNLQNQWNGINLKCGRCGGADISLTDRQKWRDEMDEKEYECNDCYNTFSAYKIL